MPIDWPGLNEKDHSEKIRAIEDEHRDEGIWPPHGEYPHRYGRIADELIREVEGMDFGRMDILDVGASKGEGIRCLKEKIDEETDIDEIYATSLDPNPNLLEENKRQGNSDSYVVATGQNLPFEDGSFEITTCVEVVSYLPNGHRKKITSEVERVAKNFVGIGMNHGFDVYTVQ
ncbi:MAG: methyltransferase domain-containing protein [Candidatus Aenigmatarchaeota archaeon]